MDSQRGQWIISPEVEAEFRQTLLRLRTEGASNQETAEQLMRSTFVLEIVSKVTGGKSLRTGRGARTPENWPMRLRKDPDLRDEWRSETVYLLARRLRERGDNGCDLDLNVAGYWRIKVVYAAIKAAWNLDKPCRIRCQSLKDEAHEIIEDEFAADNLVELELRLDLTMLIDGLEDPRQRAVMRLSAMQCDYPEIAAKLGISYEQVRYAVKQARNVLLKQLRQAA